MTRFTLLLEQLRAQVHAPQEAGGRRLFENYKASVTTAYEGDLRAGVDDGNNRFKVKVAWDDRGYRFACSCGTHETRVCEHVWAAALTANDEEHFAATRTGAYVGTANDREFYYDSSGYRVPRPHQLQKPKPEPVPRWKRAIDRLTAPPQQAVPRVAWPDSRQLVYVIDRDETLLGKGLVVELAAREPRADGTLSKPKSARIAKGEIAGLPAEPDRLIVAMLVGGETATSYGSYYYGVEAASKYRLTHALARAAVPLMCRTNRCLLRSKSFGPNEYVPLKWGDDEPWQFHVEVVPATDPADPKSEFFEVRGMLERRNDRRPLDVPTLLVDAGLVFFRDVVEPLDDGRAFPWVAYLREHRALRVPAADAPQLARKLYAGAGTVPRLRLPDQLRLEEVRVGPVPHLKIVAKPRTAGYDGPLGAELSFDYDGQRVDGMSAGRAILPPDGNRVFVRDAAAEAQFHARLHQVGLRQSWDHETRTQRYTLGHSKLAKAVSALVRDGWRVEAEGKLYRQPGEFKIGVSSGVDWFELHGEVSFGDQTASLPKLLAAVRKGDSLIQLDDGTVGMLPEAWLKKYGLLVSMGKQTDDHVRFAKHQVGLLDALLAAQPEATCDEVFAQTRQMLRTFEGVQPADPPKSFTGTLRPYQSEGLGWLHFLRQFSFGGCLADDMGLGKTIQVLAMLAARKEELTPAPRRRSAPRKSSKPATSNSQLATLPRRPSLIVVPRSLIFNWTQEAARFAPTLKILDHSHAARTRSTAHFADYDVVLTTYGTLRRDIAYLKDVEFDYAILDEAQAIKNADSESAKAARLLTARHRLALSGTPVQNHLGDLWSLFEFLNPGMLGASSVLSTAGGGARSLDDDTRNLLARALRPFILRRTKEQVAKDLPEKLEQTIYCELDSAQRRHYNELKEYYRGNLLGLVAEKGIERAKIQILEALLRLRQAACHPGLIDKTKTTDASAKLDTLLPRLSEIAAEGHKALVFSQFTQFLSIVRKRLDKDEVTYEYLDGKTKDRQARVDRFQSDPDCKLFLISLKAGGVGLNLTAADYVYLLDPWWNPAVEAQAVDRTHRIGQTRQVFACRLIAKDTVEEKVLQLQQTKRALADAIINADNSLVSSLCKAELELLLS
jgi:superfamily II DNA or RNA helicase